MSDVTICVENESDLMRFEAMHLVYEMDPRVIWLESRIPHVCLMGLLSKIGAQMPSSPQLKKLVLVQTTFSHEVRSSPLMFLLRQAPLASFGMARCELTRGVYEKLCVGLRLRASTLTELIIRDMNLVAHDAYLELFCETLMSLPKLEKLILVNIGIGQGKMAQRERLLTALCSAVQTHPRLETLNLNGNTFYGSEMDDILSMVAVSKLRNFKVNTYARGALEAIADMLQVHCK